MKIIYYDRSIGVEMTVHSGNQQEWERLPMQARSMIHELLTGEVFHRKRLMKGSKSVTVEIEQ